MQLAFKNLYDQWEYNRRMQKEQSATWKEYNTQKKAGQKKRNMQRFQLNEVQHEKSAAQKNWRSERVQYENRATWMQHKKWNTIKYYRKNFKEKQHENSAIWEKSNMELG